MIVIRATATVAVAAAAAIGSKTIEVAGGGRAAATDEKRVPSNKTIAFSAAAAFVVVRKLPAAHLQST